MSLKAGVFSGFSKENNATTCRIWVSFAVELLFFQYAIQNASPSSS